MLWSTLSAWATVLVVASYVVTGIAQSEVSKSRPVAHWQQHLSHLRKIGPVDGVPVTTATQTLSAIPSGDYMALYHPHFPSHRMRIKKAHFCDPTVKYVQTDALAVVCYSHPPQRIHGLPRCRSWGKAPFVLLLRESS